MSATSLLTHIWTTQVKNDTGSAVLTDTQTIAGSNEFNEKISVPAGTTAEIDCGSIAFAKIVSIFLSSDQAVTVNTNAVDATGGQSIALAAKKAWGWNNTLATSNPVTANITKIYVINGGSSVATFRCGILLNLLV